MAKRCGTRNSPCPRPRANWWKQSLGVDWFNHNQGGSEPIPEVPVLATLGTIVDPVNGSDAANTSTWFHSSRLPVASVLKGLKFFARANGTYVLKMAVPVNGFGFTISDLETFVVSTGAQLVSVSVAGATLTQQNIPANTLIGIGASGGGFLAFTTDANGPGYLNNTNANATAGTLKVLNSAYSNQVQIQWQAEYLLSEYAPRTYIHDENFTGAVRPAYTDVGAGWSFAGGGVATFNGTAGVLDFYDVFSTDRRSTLDEISFPVLTGTWDFGTTDPITSKGVTGRINLATSQISIRNQAGTTLTGPTALSGITLQTGRYYRFTMAREGQRDDLMRFTITDTVTDVSQSITAMMDGTNCMIGAKRISPAGTTQGQLRLARYFHTVANPNFGVVGDSITFGSNATVGNGYSQLMLNDVGGQAWSAGNATTQSFHALRFWRHILNNVFLKAVTNIGTNDTSNATFETNIQAINSEAINRGNTAYYFHLGFSSDGPSNTNFTTRNAYLTTNFGTKIIQTRIPMSVGGDGVTRNNTLYDDSVHPNTGGMLVMFQRVDIDQPAILV